MAPIDMTNAQDREALCRPPQVLRWDFVGAFFSNLFGKMNSIPLPRCVRAPLFRVWGRIFEAKLEECRDPLDSYSCLQEFFSRALKDGVRPIHPAAAMVSPVDGKLVLCGEVTADRVEQVKGVTYSLSQFLGEEYKVLDCPLSVILSWTLSMWSRSTSVFGCGTFV